MLVLIINSGSSSLKYQFLDMKADKLLAKGICDRLGLENSTFTYQTDAVNIKDEPADMPDRESALKLVIDTLTDPEKGVIKSTEQISAIGHRGVHGGEYFKSATIITDEVLGKMRLLTKIAPLHNPPILNGLEVCMKMMPNVPNVIIFDTSFHSTIPDYAYIYPLPYQMYEDFKIRRYGFHGTSHHYVSREAAKFIGRDVSQLKIVSCHLGSGSSITAIKNGESVQTTMGFTPLEGLMMGTRSGTIDPAIVTYLINEEGYSASQIENILNKESGFIGVSGVSSDWRDICVEAANGNKRAELAKNMVVMQVKKYIGSYAAAMNGIDVLIFTAGIGENSHEMRNLVTTGMDFLGIKIDTDLNFNMERGINVDLTAPGAKVKTLVIPTNEELMIAKETAKIIK